MWLLESEAEFLRQLRLQETLEPEEMKKINEKQQQQSQKPKKKKKK